MQRAGRDPGIECIVREVKGERGEQRKRSEQKEERERERKEWKSVGTARLECCIESQRCRCIAYRCVTLLCSVSFNLESLAPKVKRSQLSLCAPTLLHLSSSPPTILVTVGFLIRLSSLLFSSFVSFLVHS